MRSISEIQLPDLRLLQQPFIRMRLLGFTRNLETLSERFLEFPSRVRLGRPNPIIQGIWSFQSISRILSPQYGWGRLFFQKWFRRGPLRAGHGIPSSTEGISDIHHKGDSLLKVHQGHPPKKQERTERALHSPGSLVSEGPEVAANRRSGYWCYFWFPYLHGSDGRCQEEHQHHAIAQETKTQ